MKNIKHNIIDVHNTILYDIPHALLLLSRRTWRYLCVAKMHQKRDYMITTYHNAAKVMIFKDSIIIFLWIIQTERNIVNNRNVIIKKTDENVNLTLISFDSSLCRIVMCWIIYIINCNITCIFKSYIYIYHTVNRIYWIIIIRKF